MASILKLRRGNKAQNDTFTGAEGELSYDSTAKKIRVHDGITEGGKILASEIVSVKDFGAVGDGITDDTAAIQAAIDAVNNSESYKVIHFNGGNFRASNLILHARYCSLDGDGATITFFGTGVAIKITHETPIWADVNSPPTLTNLRLYQNGGQTAIQIGGVHDYDGFIHQAFHNVVLRSFAVGIEFQNFAFDFTASRFYFTGCQQAIKVTGTVAGSLGGCFRFENGGIYSCGTTAVAGCVLPNGDWYFNQMDIEGAVGKILEVTGGATVYYNQCHFEAFSTNVRTEPYFYLGNANFGTIALFNCYVGLFGSYIGKPPFLAVSGRVMTVPAFVIDNCYFDYNNSEPHTYTPEYLETYKLPWLCFRGNNIFECINRVYPGGILFAPADSLNRLYNGGLTLPITTDFAQTGTGSSIVTDSGRNCIQLLNGGGDLTTVPLKIRKDINYAVFMFSGKRVGAIEGYVSAIIYFKNAAGVTMFNRNVNISSLFTESFAPVVIDFLMPIPTGIDSISIQLSWGLGNLEVLMSDLYVYIG